MSTPPADPVANADATGPALTIRVAIDKTPHPISAIVWRYRPDDAPDGKVGLISTAAPELPLGVPAGIKDFSFRVKGKVLQLGDNPPAKYTVVVTVTQGTTELLKEVPPQGGTGDIGNQDKEFDYSFKVKTS